MLDIILMTPRKCPGYNRFMGAAGVIEKARSLPIEEQAAYVWRYGSGLPGRREEQRITELSKEYLSQKHNSVFDVDYNKIPFPSRRKAKCLPNIWKDSPILRISHRKTKCGNMWKKKLIAGIMTSV